MTPPRVITPEDVLNLRSVADAQLSPDGEWVAFVVAEAFRNAAKEPRSRIWLVPAAGGEARPITGGPRADRSPRWSPDGRTLAFLSDRKKDGQHQIYLLPAAGGEAEALTDMGESVSALQWSPDGARLAFQMRDPETDAERKRREERDDALEVEKHPKFTRLYTVERAGRTVRRVTGDYQVWASDWSPDGRDLALVVSDLPWAWSWYGARLVRIPATGGEARPVCATGKQLARPLWSPDGGRIAFLSCTWSDQGVIGGDLWVAPAAGGPARNLTEGYAGSVSWMEWRPGGESLLGCAHADGRISLFEQDLDPPARRPRWDAEATFAERAWARFSAARGGAALAVAKEDAARPRDIWTARPAKEGLEWTQVTRLNPQAEALTLGETRTLRWRAPDGRRIQGLLVLPAGRREGAPCPLVTQVHGGPANLWAHRFHAGVTLWAQLLAGQGIATLLPNPRGSTGWGTEFTEANLGDMGGRDLEDILAGVDFCVEQGLADPERLGIGGWSYGGFMTALAVTRTNRFRAAVMGAGICNWRSFHGCTDIPTWDTLFYRSGAYEPGGVYDRFSAVLHADRIRTPTLILHGEKDTCVPVGQAHEFFRALKDHGVETELVVYPREGHGIAEKHHQADVMRRVLAWYGERLAAPVGETP